MIRTTTYLPKQLYADIQRLAQRDGKTAADMHRELVQRGIQSRRHTVKTKVVATHGSLLDLANLHITGGPKDLSTNADHYLYGED